MIEHESLAFERPNDNKDWAVQFTPEPEKEQMSKRWVHELSQRLRLLGLTGDFECLQQQSQVCLKYEHFFNFFFW